MNFMLVAVSQRTPEMACSRTWARRAWTRWWPWPGADAILHSNLATSRLTQTVPGCFSTLMQLPSSRYVS